MKPKKAKLIVPKQNRDKYLDSMLNIEKNLIVILEKMLDNEITLLGNLKTLLGYAKSIVEEIDDDKLKGKEEKPVVEIGVDSITVKETE